MLSDASFSASRQLPASISPTDITTFIRLEQCERYLRLRLQERANGIGFMKEFGVVPQEITPLLRFSGERFEDELAEDFQSKYAVVDCAADTNSPTSSAKNHAPTRDNSAPKSSSRTRGNDNDRVLETIRNLKNGVSQLLLQPRLECVVEGWHLRGDVDILRLHRTENGALRVLVVDMKSSAAPKVEHRLQVAFYHKMLEVLLNENALSFAEIELGILYRGEEENDLDAVTQRLRASHQAAAQQEFGSARAFLELIDDKESYLESVRDLVTGVDSRSVRVAQMEFDAVPFHLESKCDGCRYQEFCLKWSAQHDDLSLVPHLTKQDKSALQRNGITTVSELAHLKQFRAETDEIDESSTQSPTSTRSSLPAYISGLVATPEKAELVKRVASTWPVGARLDELVHRARRYRKSKGDDIRYRKNIPSKGYGSLPFCSAEHNPNLVRIFIDAQHDYLHDRLYLLGALVTASENGEVARRRHVVHVSATPPGEIGEMTDENADSHEAKLLSNWLEEMLATVYELAAPDESGEKSAPVHLIFWNSSEQQSLLEALGRHASTILSATPLYDFVTQMAAFDSPVASFLDQEIRELKNYPLLAQTLQGVSQQLHFQWNTPQSEHDFREIFHARHFDAWGKLDGDDLPENDAVAWYARRARFRSSIPLEYAYAAWGALPIESGKSDDFAAFRGATLENIAAFQARRLDALEHITNDFDGNKQTLKSNFSLPDLEKFECKAHTMAHALDEFVTIERHVEIAAWKKARLAPPERRMVAGDTLIVRYLEEDQEEGTAQRNRDNEERRLLHEAWKAENPDAKRRPKDVMAATDWKMEGMVFRLRVDCAAADCSLEHALAISSLRIGERVVISPRVTQDSRLEIAERVDFTPTAKQLMYAMRVDIKDIEKQFDAQNRLTHAWIHAEISPTLSGGKSRGFVFGARLHTLFAGASYTLDSDPNDWQGNNCSQLTQKLCEGEPSTLLNRLKALSSTRCAWPTESAAAQQRFLDGLDALCAANAFHELESGKRDFIAKHGDTPILLVQGPPGTGKSYSTAFALLARMQGAMAAETEFRIGVTCRNHAATDVLVANIIKVKEDLRVWSEEHPQIFARYFDARLLDVPIFRLAKTETQEGAIALPRDRDREKEQLSAFKAVSAESWCFVAGTPGGTLGLLKDAKKELFATHLYGCLVLDEASQMNLPEAVMASLTLRDDGQLIVVGDHRQMPPIIKHDWKIEPRRTFAEFKSYASLFETLLELQPTPPPKINFEESFRLHADMAEFLRREIYRHDGINYHSKKTKTLDTFEHDDDFVRAALSPQHPLVVITHSEAGSLLSNPFEKNLISPLLEALSSTRFHALDATHGLGIVVPHRAQKAALQNELWNVDTVERFQGDERKAILVGATESDRDYLLQNGKFLFDPRRLTVALSRAKEKMILVASQSVFNVFSPDEEAFANAQLWKNLLRHTCTELLWEGKRDGETVQVWGNIAPKVLL